ncbi:MAG TPA: DinB family protein [Chitinophagaceae bacterium]|nr:DinB family protein [Chitinophagaceae bacterium]
MKDYLTETFNYNSNTNKKLLDKIAQLNDKRESIQLFSHLINCQYKWLARILKTPGYEKMSWWEPVYEFDKLEPEWNKSTEAWINYLNSKTDGELDKETIFTGADGAIWAATPKDIALQLNYHSIHHRAQIQMLIRRQGIEPDFVDYIGTKYRKIG